MASVSSSVSSTGRERRDVGDPAAIRRGLVLYFSCEEAEMEEGESAWLDEEE